MGTAACHWRYAQTAPARSRLECGMSVAALDVMHVIPGLRVGGAENMLANLVTAERGYPIEQEVVNLMGPGGIMAQRISGAGIVVSDLGATSLASYLLAVLRLAHLIRVRRPRVIQSWLYYGDLAAYWALLLSGRRAATRLYWGVRASDMDQTRYGASLRLAIRTCAFHSPGPDAVIANSHAGRAEHERIGFRPKHFVVIPNGIDTHKFRPDPAARARVRARLAIAPDAPVVIHSARVDPMKDHATFLEVAAQLPEVTFVLVGSGTHDLPLHANTLPLGLRTDMPELYAAADLAVSTSAFGEGFPTVLGEAMATGLSVVATDVGDSRLLVGDVGMIVPPRNPARIAMAIRNLLAAPAPIRTARRAAARERIEVSFSLTTAVQRFDNLHLHGLLPVNRDALPREVGDVDVHSLNKV